MLLVIALALVVLLAYGTAQLSISLGRRDNPSVVSAPRPSEWKRAQRGARRRSVIATGTGLVALVLFVVVPYPLGWTRVGALTGPLLSTALGLATFAFLPRQVGESAIRTDLWRRGKSNPFTYVTKGYALSLIAAFGLLIGMVVVAGVVGGSDDAGHWGRGLQISREGVSTTIGRFPGWYYGVPILVSIFFLAAATATALRKVSVAPSLSGSGLDVASRRWSVGSARIIILLTLATLFLEMAAFMFMAMSAARRGLAEIDGADERPWWMTALAQLVVAAGFAAFGCLAHALYNAITLPQRTAAALIGGDQGVTLP